MSQVLVPSVLDTLNTRNKELAPDAFSYKIGPAGSSYGLDVPIIGELDIDPHTMSMWIPIASGVRRDGVGDLLDVDGINTSRHIKNPIVLFDHGKEVSRPIARARENPKDVDSYTFKIDAVNKSAGCRAYFYQGKDNCALTGGCQPGTHAQFCEELFDMAANGFIGAGSIGYQVISAEHMPPDYTSGTPQGLHLKKILMLEGSLVVLPASIDTVAKALTGGRILGRLPSPEFKAAFKSCLPAKKAMVVGGFDSKALKVPNYRKAEDPKKECDTCQAYAPQGGQYGHCRMFDVQVGPEMVCDRWTAASKAFLHGPGCSCPACKPVVAKKDCGCHSCSQGQACPCGKKSLSDIRGKYRTKDEEPSVSSASSSVPRPNQPGSQRRSAKIDLGTPAPQPAITPASAQPRPGAASTTPPAAPVAQRIDAPVAQLAPDQTPQSAPPRKLNQQQPPQQVIDQYLSAFQQRLETATPEQITAMLNHNAQLLGHRYGQQAAAYFNRRAQHLLDNHQEWLNRPKSLPVEKQKIIKHEGDQWNLYSHEGRILGHHDSKEDALRQERAIEAHKHGGKAMSEYIWDAKSLGDLRGKYRQANGRLRRLRKSRPGQAIVHVGTKDVDKLRQAAASKGVAVTWMNDDGKGLSKVKLSGDDKVVDELAAGHGKMVRRGKSLPRQGAKATNPIGTLPSGSRERDSLSPETLLNSPGGSEEQGEPDAFPVLTAKSKGKSMKRRIKDGNELLLPDDGGAPHGEGNPDLGGGEPPLDESNGSTPTDLDEGQGDMEPYGAQILRRLHADAAGLLHEYDSMMEHLEDESTRQLLRKKLETLVHELEELESHKDSHERYKDLPPFEGTEGDMLKQERTKDELGGLQADSSQDEEPTPDEALEGMRAQEKPPLDEEDEDGDILDISPEEKALYFKQVENLRQRHIQGQAKGMAQGQQQEAKFLRKQLKALGATDKDEESKKKRKYLMQRLKKLDTKAQPSDAINPSKARQILKDGEANGHKLTAKQQGMFGAAAGKKNLEATTPIMTKTMDEDYEEEKKYLQRRWKALKEDDEDDKDVKDEKSYIVSRWKTIKEEEEKSLEDKLKKKEKSPLDKFVGKFSHKHVKSVAAAQAFLKALEDEDDYEDEHRLKAYHHGHELHGVVDDVMDDGNGGGLDNLAKTLLTEEDVDVPHPSSPSKLGHDKMPFDEGKHAARGVKDFPEMGQQDREVNVTAPSSNAWVKPGADAMPYDQGSHILGKDFPEMHKQTAEAGVEDPSSNSQLKVGKEPMQQFGCGRSLVKYLKGVAEAAVFLKALATEKAFGVKHKEMAGRLAKALALAAPQAKSQIPGDLDYWKEEEEEPEHQDHELKDLDGYEPGEMGQKALDTIMANTLQTSQAINGLSSTVQSLLERL